MNNIKLLDSNISRLVTLRNSNNVENQLVVIKDQVKQLFLEKLLPEEFTTLLNATVIDPVLTRIKHLKDNLPLADRGTIKERTNTLSLIRLLEDFLETVYSNYHPYLKDSQYYLNSQEKNIIDREIQRDTLLNPRYDEIHLVIDLEPNHCKEFLDKGYDVALTYFSRSQAGIDLRQEAISFTVRGESLLDYMREELPKLKQALELLKQSKTGYSGIFTEEGEEGEDSIDLQDLYNSKTFHLLCRIENVGTYCSVLGKLIKIVSEMYSLRTSKSIQPEELTVFGNSNFEIVDKLFDVLQPFLHVSTKREDFTHAFTLQANYDREKIKFSKVSLNNYGGLISKIHPYFEITIQSRLKYNQWWADRFTYNGDDKTKSDISNMRSASKEPDRRPDHPAVIKEAVDILKEI